MTRRPNEGTATRVITIDATRRSGGHVAVLALVMGISLAACSPAATDAPDGDPPGPTGPTPIGTDPGVPSPIDIDPGARPPPLAREPLPEPQLIDPFEIGDAIFMPSTRAQGVVSMLRGLGVGIYHRDGTPIRRGDERSSTDLWLYEDEVYALIDMAAAESARDLISFRQWHAALVPLGLEMSVTDLARAYEEAYFWEHNESFFVNLIVGTGLDIYGDDPSGTYLTGLQAWLLLLDGFVVVTEDSLAAGVTVSNFRSALTGHDREKWGGASSNIPRILSPADMPNDVFASAARLETLTRSVTFQLTPGRHDVHEGHGVEGAPVDFELWFWPLDQPALTPFGDEWFLQAAGEVDGLPVRWEASSADVANKHGTLRDHEGRDPLVVGAEPTKTRHGRAVVRYTPRREEAEGEGEVVADRVRLSAEAELHEVARRTWHVPEVLLSYLRQRGAMTVSAELEIEWHEIRGLRIDMTDEYDVRFEFPTFIGDMSLGEVRRVGTDRIIGFLALQDDGTYRGIVRGTTNGEYYQRALDEECSTTLAGSQELLATGEIVERGHAGDPGFPLRLRFYPIASPEIDAIGCDYELNRYEDNPRLGIRWGFYAPFNDLRIIDPDVVGFLTAMPPLGEWTYVYSEHLPDLGGGTWRVTVEVVEPEG